MPWPEGRRAQVWVGVERGREPGLTSGGINPLVLQGRSARLRGSNSKRVSEFWTLQVRDPGDSRSSAWLGGQALILPADSHLLAKSSRDHETEEPWLLRLL